MLKELDAVPTVAPPAEVCTLLERKGVDAVQRATPRSNPSGGFDKAGKYIVLPGS